jgi:hypothetical protein
MSTRLARARSIDHASAQAAIRLLRAERPGFDTSCIASALVVAAIAGVFAIPLLATPLGWLAVSFVEWAVEHYDATPASSIAVGVLGIGLAILMILTPPLVGIALYRVMRLFHYENWIDELQAAHRCLACAYDLSSSPTNPRGAITCPECGASSTLPSAEKVAERGEAG